MMADVWVFFILVNRNAAEGYDVNNAQHGAGSMLRASSIGNKAKKCVY